MSLSFSRLETRSQATFFNYFLKDKTLQLGIPEVRKKKKKGSLFFLNATLMFWPNLFQLLRKFASRQKPFILSFTLQRIYQWSG